MRRWILVLSGLGASAFGCLGASAFACSEDSQCFFDGSTGKCEDIGFCSFPDLDCESKQRFGEHAGGGLANQCVPTDDDGTESTGGPTTDPDETDDDTETGTEEDTSAPLPDVMEDPCADYAAFTEVVEDVAFAELAQLRADCTGPSSPLNTCLGAASDWCEGYGGGCYSGGVGVLEATLTHATVICISNLGDMYETTPDAIIDASNISAAYLDDEWRHAQGAVNAWCKQQGYAHGMGPMELDKDASYARVLCLPDEIADNETFTGQQLADLGCPSPVAPHDAACSTAAHLACLALGAGYNGGYGPHGFNGSMEVATCFW